MGLGDLKLVEATVLALPIVSSRTLSPTEHGIAPIAVPISASDIKTDRSLRTVDRGPSAQRPQTQQVTLSQPTVESEAPVTPEGGHAGDLAAQAEANPEAADIPVPATVAQIAPQRSDTNADATAQNSRASWTAAADGGVAIGRKSRDAGIATAGFFSRFAHRVAGSF
jgi:hypothetical protein